MSCGAAMNESEGLKCTPDVLSTKLILCFTLSDAADITSCCVLQTRLYCSGRNPYISDVGTKAPTVARSVI